ncbi:MAG: T9SS type A sorting domain-containing protein, partial [Salinivirgaceae bacterium]
FSILLPAVAVLNNQLIVQCVVDLQHLFHIGDGVVCKKVIGPIPNFVFGGTYNKFIVYSNQTSSINPHDSQAVSVYPNPTADICTIKGIKQPIDILIYDLCGNIVRETEVTRTVNLSELTPGVYFLQIDTEAGRVTKSIIKK